MHNSSPAVSSLPDGLSFDRDDKLQRKPFCQQLERYLIVESNFIEGSLVATLAASFGSGKTTFIEMWKKDLLDRRHAPNAEAAFMAPMPVILNAWESDFCGDPLVDILLGLSEAIEKWTGADKPSPIKQKAFIQASKKAVLMVASLANGVVAQTTGADYLKAEEWANEQMANGDPKAPDFMALFKSRKQSLQDLRRTLEDTFSPNPPPETAESSGLPKTSTPKVIIFVDELDRCRPDYAIHYLETIKHVFNIKGIVFVLAIDAQQLEVSAKALFGEKLNFPEYYRKFSHRTFHLPQPEEGAIGMLLEEMVDKHIICRGQRQSAFKPGEYIINMVAPLVRAWKVNPRQLHEAFRILGHALTIEGEHGTMQTHNATISLAYLYACLARTAASELYEELQAGRSNLVGYTVFRSQVPMEKNNIVAWIYILAAGTNSDMNGMSAASETNIKECTKNGDIQARLEETQARLGHFPHPFQLICKRIENALRFEDEQERK